jgi:hypothetical protein
MEHTEKTLISRSELMITGEFIKTEAKKKKKISEERRQKKSVRNTG